MSSPHLISRYRLTEQARQGLDELWLYIAEGNPTAADRFLDAPGVGN
jgi:plasmid stabilization system protein ParE